ncbi:recombinase family protein [Shewanella algae]|uniref:recombinase family protein n=1 Tax=Shewanella algae TaxID=38313 RepID=UPI003AAEB366
MTNNHQTPSPRSTSTTTRTPPQVVSYSRYSTKKQSKGFSLERQDENLKRWSDANGIPISELSFADLGISAFSGTAVREGLANMLEAVRQGAVPQGWWIAFERIDRLSRRGITETRRLIDQILQHGVNIVCIGEGIELRPDDDANDELKGSLMVAIHAHLAREQSAKASERIRSTAAAKRRRARETGAPIKKRLPYWLELSPDGSKYQFKAGRIETVRYIVKRRLEGRGFHGICAELNAMNTPPLTRMSKQWNDMAIAATVRNVALFGQYQPAITNEVEKVDSDGRRKMVRVAIPDGEPLDNYFPAVVDRATWDQIQSDSRTKMKAGRRGDNPVSGLTFCRHCGGTLPMKPASKTSTNGTRHTYRYWTCRGAVDGKCDHGKGIKDLDHFVVKACRRIVPRTLGQGDGGQDPAAAFEYQSLLERRGKVTTQIATLDAAMADPELGAAALKHIARQIDVATANLEQVDAAIATVEARQKADQDTTPEAVEKLKQLEGDPVAYNLHLKTLVHRIVAGAVQLDDGSWSDVALLFRFTVELLNGQRIDVTVSRRNRWDKDPVEFYSHSEDATSTGGEGDLFPWETDDGQDD